MASETGHAKNVANFETLIAVIQQIGADYNPPRTNLKLPALLPMPTAASDAISETNFHAAEKTSAVRERETAFDKLSPLVSRVIGAIELRDAEPLIGDRARALARKLRGGRAGEKPVDDPSTPDIDESQTAHSVSQMSYDSRLGNFDALITLLESQAANYITNEADLKTDALRDFYNDLRAKNTAANNAAITLENSRDTRDGILYGEPSGLVPIANDIKTYFKSTFGKDSQRYAQVKDLEFRKPR